MLCPSRGRREHSAIISQNGRRLSEFRPLRYEWNEWGLRRRALRMAALKKCTTSSQQTDASHYRRDNTSQVRRPSGIDIWLCYCLQDDVFTIPTLPRCPWHFSRRRRDRPQAIYWTIPRPALGLSTRHPAGLLAKNRHDAIHEGIVDEPAHPRPVPDRPPRRAQQARQAAREAAGDGQGGFDVRSAVVFGGGSITVVRGSNSGRVECAWTSRQGSESLYSSRAPRWKLKSRGVVAACQCTVSPKS